MEARVCDLATPLDRGQRPEKNEDWRIMLTEKRVTKTRATKAAIEDRVAALAWPDILSSLWTNGYGRTGAVLSAAECEMLRGLYDNPDLFRSRIDMARFRFGRGEYKYFAYPLPSLVAGLRRTLYSKLAGCANEWAAALSQKGEFPSELDGFLRLCQQGGQARPTPLILRYQAGDFNSLHQDLYGEVAFPFQVIFCLSRPAYEFTGGELMLVEQQPRAQSTGHVIQLGQGEAVVITTRYRPVKSARGYYRTNFRHGVSRVLTGERYTMGVVFHDAK
jgi:hypothetical protein